MAAGTTLVFISSLVLQLKALSEFGIIRSWIVPFEEIVLCFKNWKSARFAAKSLLIGFVLILTGFMMLMAD